MKSFRLAGTLIALAVSSNAIAADLLPLKQGIYVPVKTPCKGASNADILNYWGADSSIGASQAQCKARKVTHVGPRYTIVERCTDLQSGDAIAGPPVTVTIPNPTSFTMDGVAYRYCGTRVQF